MNTSNRAEKIQSSKTRAAWNEEVIRKGDKRNKTKRDRTEKRAWMDLED
ncbi:hypothetical protein MOO17_11195 [Escherichia coli]|jgi:hypothetical protein|nr:hypothetical protein [Escherichia coli]MCJ8478594.1 hypothetical protein [Escherichia coli]BDU12186.1 hypothetical protein [Escherichia phage phiWec179]BDU12409.1 hypothetical protein [Escherichia phage phiWec181]BDU12849.1 hypothetical protein [Escherichia phage phiWec186]